MPKVAAGWLLLKMIGSQLLETSKLLLEVLRLVICAASDWLPHQRWSKEVLSYLSHRIIIAVVNVGKEIYSSDNNSLTSLRIGFSKILHNVIHLYFFLDHQSPIGVQMNDNTAYHIIFILTNATIHAGICACIKQMAVIFSTKQIPLAVAVITAASLSNLAWAESRAASGNIVTGRTVI